MEETNAPAVPTQTLGEKLAGVTFNPSQDPKVTACKEKFAGIIDELQMMKHRPHDTNGEWRNNVIDMAIEKAFTAQMLMVKALTW